MPKNPKSMFIFGHSNDGARCDVLSESTGDVNEDNDAQIVVYNHESARLANLSYFRLEDDQFVVTVLKDIAVGEECFRKYSAACWWSTLNINPKFRDNYALNFKRIISACSEEERYLHIALIVRSEAHMILIGKSMAYFLADKGLSE
jgi:hypothetical protein